MGLAASQGRYLCLTARLNDLVYEGQQISQQRLNLATETQAIADRYADATNNRKMVAYVYKGGDESKSQVDLSYDLLTKSVAEYGLGYRLVDKNGAVVVPGKNSMSISSKNEVGEMTTEIFYNKESFISKYLPELSDEKKQESFEKLIEFYNKTNEKNPLTFEKHQSYPEHITQEGDTFCYDEFVTDNEYLHNMLITGDYLLQKIENPETQEWKEITWQGSNDVTEIYDTSDDAAAEAEYESAMKELQRRDKLLELRLEQVETEEGAVEKELESVKGVIDKNIENSFKTFA